MISRRSNYNTHSAGVVGGVQMERISRFTKTIQVGRWRQSGPQTEVLRLKDKRCSRCVEEGFVGLPTRNGKRERVVGPGECQGRVFRVDTFIIGRTRPDRLLDLEDLFGSIVDLDVKPVGYGRCQHETDD